MSFYTILTELQQINLAQKAWNSLSSEAKYAIETWESANWTGGALEQHIKANDEIAQELAKAIQPVIESIGTPTIHLYRGYTKNNGEYEGWKNKILESWTSDKKVAEHFAGLRDTRWRSLLRPEITDEEINATVLKLEQTGYARFRGYKYVVPKEKIEWNGWYKPKGTYYRIYNAFNNEMITDGDDLYETLKDDQKWIAERNKKLLDNAVVLEEDIDVDRIIWVTNNLDSKEFIIRI